jgi:hypothetical protein
MDGGVNVASAIFYFTKAGAKVQKQCEDGALSGGSSNGPPLAHVDKASKRCILPRDSQSRVSYSADSGPSPALYSATLLVPVAVLRPVAGSGATNVLILGGKQRNVALRRRSAGASHVSV